MIKINEAVTREQGEFTQDLKVDRAQKINKEIGFIKAIR
ncbi:MAG: hypothetical protein PWP22_1566 [Thermoanaerobacter sp.]|nr:hypothetical protein [Thermoanaerobacter sp.]